MLNIWMTAELFRGRQPVAWGEEYHFGQWINDQVFAFTPCVSGSYYGTGEVWVEGYPGYVPETFKALVKSVTVPIVC
jgi:hypothetical protein